MSIVDEIRARVKVDEETGCWVWQEHTDRDGYGLFWRNAKRYRVHRLMYELHNGESPGTLNVCHDCDNPPCCNPAHLWLGTNGDNTRDAMRKGRLAVGDRSGVSRFTIEIVTEAVDRVARGESQASVSRSLGISTGALQCVLLGRTWQQVDTSQIELPGKGVKGERHYLSKLNADSVREIRRLRAEGETPSVISKKFGVCPANVVNICKRKTWAHVE